MSKITDVGAAFDPQFERVSDTPRTDEQYNREKQYRSITNVTMSSHGFDAMTILCAELERELAEAQAKISATRRWVNNNMTFYDVEPDGPSACTSGPNIPTLCSVSKRIWYHATDNQTVSLFSDVIDAAMQEGK